MPLPVQARRHVDFVQSITADQFSKLLHLLEHQNAYYSIRMTRRLDHVWSCTRVIQHELLPSSGSEFSGSSPRVGSGPNSQLQDDEMHVTAEPIQWWDVCRRTNWPERDENIANIVLYNQRNYMMAMDASDCEDSEHSDSTPSNDGISGKETMRVRERSSWYLSNAEVQINSWRIPIWQKSKVCSSVFK